MKKCLCIVAFICLILFSGCTQSDMKTESADLPSQVETQAQSDVSGTTAFVSGMGCSVPNCTDPSHYHDCPPDCMNYEHHHNCGLDCTDASHHHRGAGNVNRPEQRHTEQHHGEHHDESH